MQQMRMLKIQNRQYITPSPQKKDNIKKIWIQFSLKLKREKKKVIGILEKLS